MDKITSLLAVIAFVAANTQHQDQVYNILVVVKKNSSVFQEAKGLIRKNFSSSLNGYWAVNFIEYRVISSVPQSFLILANNFTRNSTFDGIIFVDISKSTAMLSQSLMAIIPTIGLQDTGPEVLASLSYFTRVPTPPLQKFAYVIKDLIKKMGWRKIFIIDTADTEGLQFARYMLHYGKEEQWSSVTYVLLDDIVTKERLTEIHTRISNATPDIIIANNIEHYISKALTNTTPSIWLITDLSLISMETLPAGILRINKREDSLNYHYHRNLKLLIHAMTFFESAVNLSILKLCQGDDVIDCANRLNRLVLRQEVIRYISDGTPTSQDSVFYVPGLYDRPKNSFDLLNLHVDDHGKKQWYNVGMWTPGGIALNTFINQHKVKIEPQMVSPRPVLRVPVVTVPSWMTVGDPFYPSGDCLSGYPCHQLNEKGKKIAKYCCLGAQIDLIKLLEDDLNFEAFIYFTPDGQWGGINSTTGDWTGLMKELTTHNADVTSFLGISQIRNEAVEFTQPYMELGLNILVHNTNESSPSAVINWKFLDPFKADLWLMIIGFSNVFLVVIWGLDRLSPHGHRRRIAALLQEQSYSQDDGFTLLDSMSYVWGVAFSKEIGAENTPKSPSARIVSIFFAFMALILVNTYCANLTAVLMEANFTSPIDGIRDERLTNPLLYPPDGFQLGVVRGSIEEWYFKNHSDKQIQHLYHINIKINLVHSYIEGFSQLEKKKLDGLVGDTITLQAQARNTHCKFRLIGKSFYNFGVGFAFPKGSPWIDKATLTALKHQENGTIERIKKLRFPTSSCTNSHARDFGIADFSGLFVLVASVVIFGVLALFVEIILIIILTKYWTLMGCLASKLRYFFLGIEKNEENIDFQFFRSFGKKSWDVNHDNHVKTNGHIQNGIGRTEFGNIGRAGLKNYGFSGDVDDDWLRSSRGSARSLSISEFMPSEHKTGEICNGCTNNTKETAEAQ